MGIRQSKNVLLKIDKEDLPTLIMALKTLEAVHEVTKNEPTRREATGVLRRIRDQLL